MFSSILYFIGSNHQIVSSIRTYSRLEGMKPEEIYSFLGQELTQRTAEGKPHEISLNKEVENGTMKASTWIQ